MSDTGTPALVIGGIALLSALGALLKIVKQSDCWGIHITTRTPTEEHPQIILAPPPSPTQHHARNKSNENIADTPIEIQV